MKKLDPVHLRYDSRIKIHPSVTLKPGTKFRLPGDNDPWHIVWTSNDNGNMLVIYKSWSKYRQGWIYKVEIAEILLFTLSINDELYIDENGDYIIKDGKKK